jgi:Uma2 family endonuclease
MTAPAFLGGIVIRVPCVHRPAEAIDMVMPAANPPSPVRWNRAMLEALPDDRQRHEIIDGEHYMTPSPGFVHQRVITRVLVALEQYVAAERVGWAVTAPSDIELAEDTIVQPDITVFARKGAQLPRTWAEGGLPILAVEVISPSSAGRDRILKRRRYQRAGIAEYWIVDPDARLIERWMPDDARPEIITDTLHWSPPGAGTALSIELDAIFAASE